MKDRPNGYAVLVGGVVWGAFPRKRRRDACEYESLVRSEMERLPDEERRGVRVETMVFSAAVTELRKLVFRLADYRCAKCGRTVTWQSGEMHEKESRGKGGPRTVHNCEVLCNAHHTGHAGEHGFARGRIRILL